MFGEAVEENLKGMEQWIGGLAVVTGASSGIGAVISRKLVRAGVIVVGLARRLELLEELGTSLEGEKGTFHPKQCDLTNEEDILATFQWIEESLGPISIMINNAGVLHGTDLKEGDSDHWRNAFDVNVIAVCFCSREAIKSMKTHGIDGHIVTMGSDNGHYPPEHLPLLNVFPATKYALLSITEALRRELTLANTNIKVSNICPGVTESDFYNEYPAEAIEDIPKLQPEDVANAVLYVLAQPPGVQVQDVVIRRVGRRSQWVV